MVWSKFGRMLIAALALVSASTAWSKTLIEMSGTTPAPALASAWNKAGAGTYEFTLDTTKEVSSGVPVNAAVVKSSLEAKMGSTFGVKVTDKGNNVVSVAYTGDEAAFLQEVAKTKIRGGDNVELALDSSVSQGSIRANPGARGPGPGEVKAMVLKIKPGIIVAQAIQSNAPGVKNGANITVKADGSKMVAGHNFFFKPEKKDGADWLPKAGSVTLN